MHVACPKRVCISSEGVSDSNEADALRQYEIDMSKCPVIDARKFYDRMAIWRPDIGLLAYIGTTVVEAIFSARINAWCASMVGAVSGLGMVGVVLTSRQ